MKETLGYQKILIAEYSQRRNRNAAYSLRAFARDLEVAYSRLHEAVSGKGVISPRTAQKIANGLGLKNKEAELFVTEVEALYSRSALTRSKALLKLKKITRDDTRQSLAEDTFAVISQWYHLAILEIYRIKDARLDSASIAKRLGMQAFEVTAAIERLLRTGLLQKSGTQLCPKTNFVFTSTDIPSAAIKLYQEQILEQAKQALHFHPIDTRDITSIVMAISSDEIPDAKSLLKDFRRSFSDRLEAADSKDSVYCLGLQFFRLDKAQKDGL